MIFKQYKKNLNILYKRKQQILDFIKKEGLQDKIDQQINKKAINKPLFGSNKEGHIPVMLQEVIKTLESPIKQKKEHQQTPPNQQPPQLLIDLTFGLGGHSLALMKRHPQMKVIGLELDQRVLAYFEQNIRPKIHPLLSQRLSLYNLNYTQIDNLMSQQQLKASWMIGDFGVNSLHFDQKEWGFSYTGDAQLDMRFDPSQGISASNLLNNLDTLTLQELLSSYGQLKSPLQLAEKIIQYRSQTPINTAIHLRECILGSGINGHSNYVTLVQVCQALRIAVNQELQNLYDVMQIVPNVLDKDGRAVFLTFHSLERQIVKSAIKQFKKNGSVKMLDCNVQPQDKEIEENPRARSTQLFSMIKL